MAEISKLKLPNGDEYDLKVSVEHISGQLSITNGGTGASTASAARTSLGLGTAAIHNTSDSVENNTNIPTGAAIETRVSNHVIVSSTQPSNQKAGDIWMITAESTGLDDGDSISYGDST